MSDKNWEDTMSRQRNTINLTGRFAVVTGGAQGIGLAVTRRLLDSGASVAIWDMDTEEMDRAAAALGVGGGSRPSPANQSDWQAVSSAAAETERAFGRIDILVNNAGIAVPRPR